MVEEWKEYCFGNLNYMVSNYGTIIGLARGRELKQRLNRDGYLFVTVGDLTHRTSKPVHRIIAELFVENDDPANKVEVNHIDTNRQNPKADNLEWTTHLDNVRHSVELGNYEKPYFKGSGNPNYGNDTLKKKYAENPELAKINNARPATQNGRARKIELYDADMNYINTFGYIGECCEFLKNTYGFKAKLDCIRSNIRKCVNLNKEYNGFKFRILD